MKQLFFNRIVPVVITVGVVVVFALGSNVQHQREYHIGYQDAIRCYQQWLLDVDYAEYNKKTGEWQLVDPNTIQGNLIEPHRRPQFVHIDDHIQALEHELAIARKQQSASKRQTKPTLDVKKMP